MALSHCATQSLVVVISYESALTVAVAYGCTAEGLHVCVADEATLAASTTGVGSALRLKIRVFDEPTLFTLCVWVRRATD